MNELPLSRKGVITTIAVAGIVAAIAVGAATYRGSDEESEPQATEPSPTTEPLDADAAIDWLPYTPEELLEASAVAAEYTELYITVSDGESVDAFYETLHSYTTKDYADRLEPAAGVHSAREGLAEEGVTISAATDVDRVRVLVEDQITFIVAATTTTHSDQGRQNDDYEFAVTVTPDDDRWKVHDLRLATEGQPGDTEAMPGT